MGIRCFIVFESSKLSNSLLIGLRKNCAPILMNSGGQIKAASSAKIG